MSLGYVCVCVCVCMYVYVFVYILVNAGMREGGREWRGEAETETVLS